jgi:hypothetical protein
VIGRAGLEAAHDRLAGRLDATLGETTDAMTYRDVMHVVSGLDLTIEDLTETLNEYAAGTKASILRGAPADLALRGLALHAFALGAFYAEGKEQDDD